MTMSRMIRLAGVLLVLVAAAGLRLPQLDERPLHADEAVNTMILFRSMGPDGYRFDPTHYHGPIQPILARVIPLAKNWSEYVQYQIRPLRMIPVTAGLLTVLLLFAFSRALGFGAFVAALGAAVSPLLVYYSRMWIHESLLGLFAMGSLIALWRAVECTSQRTRMGWALVAGLTAGLALATKATIFITFASWTAAFVVVWGVPTKADIQRLWIPAIVAGVLALVIATALYTDFGRYPSAAWEAVHSLFIYQKGAGHDYPFFHHVRLIFAPKYRAGYWWGETALGVLAVIGAVRAWSGMKTAPTKVGPYTKGQRFARFLAWATLFHWLVYSLIAYKTPWLLLVPMLHTLLLAGYGAAWPFERPARSWMRITAAIVLAAAFVHLGLQSRRACSRYAADGRNPYAYSPTSTDAVALEKLLIAVADANPDLRAEPISVSKVWKGR